MLIGRYLKKTTNQNNTSVRCVIPPPSSERPLTSLPLRDVFKFPPNITGQTILNPNRYLYSSRFDILAPYLVAFAHPRHRASLTASRGVACSLS